MIDENQQPEPEDETEGFVVQDGQRQRVAVDHYELSEIARLSGGKKYAAESSGQLTDVYQEQNGIYNYDRTPKFDAETIRNIFSMKPSWSKL